MKIYGTGFIKTGKKGNYLKCKGAYLSKLENNEFKPVVDADKNFYIRCEEVEDRKVIYKCEDNEKFTFVADYVSSDETTVVITNLERK